MKKKSVLAPRTKTITTLKTGFSVLIISGVLCSFGWKKPLERITSEIHQVESVDSTTQAFRWLEVKLQCNEPDHVQSLRLIQKTGDQEFILRSFRVEREGDAYYFFNPQSRRLFNQNRIEFKAELKPTQGKTESHFITYTNHRNQTKKIKL